MGFTAGTESEGAAKSAASRGETRPTFDQMYLASRLSPEDSPKASITPAAIQRLNSRYGRQVVIDALRIMRGFPPEIAVRSPYAYLEGICRRQS